MSSTPMSHEIYDSMLYQTKETLKNCLIDTKQAIDSIRSLGNIALSVAKSYSNLCINITLWSEKLNVPLEIIHSIEKYNQSVNDFKNIVVDDFLKTIVPNFETVLNFYGRKQNELVDLAKKSENSIHELDQAQKNLKLSGPINSCYLNNLVKEKENECKQMLVQFVKEVNDFQNDRKTIFVNMIKECFRNLVEFINKATQIQTNQLPCNYQVLPTNTGNNSSILLNQIQPILPPAMHNQENQSQMPFYVSNSNIYSETSPIPLTNSISSEQQNVPFSTSQSYDFQSDLQENRMIRNYYSGPVSEFSSSENPQLSNFNSSQQFFNSNQSSAINLNANEDITSSHSFQIDSIKEIPPILPPADLCEGYQNQMPVYVSNSDLYNSVKTLPNLPIQQSSTDYSNLLVKTEPEDQRNSQIPQFSTSHFEYSSEIQENEIQVQEENRPSTFSYDENSKLTDFNMANNSSSQQILNSNNYSLPSNPYKSNINENNSSSQLITDNNVNFLSKYPNENINSCQNFQSDKLHKNMISLPQNAPISNNCRNPFNTHSNQRSRAGQF